MERNKRWQSISIGIVLFLIIYNILPTIFYYAKPLDNPVDEKGGYEVAHRVGQRVNQLETDALEWLHSFCKLLSCKPLAIEIDAGDRQFVHMRFQNAEDAKLFERHLPRAGALIPFVPAQLSLLPEDTGDEGAVVTVQRNISSHFDPDRLRADFAFTYKRDRQGAIEPLYREIIDDRVLQLGAIIRGVSENARYVDTIRRHRDPLYSDPFLLQLSRNILTYADLFGEHSPIAKRFFATCTQGLTDDKREAIAELTQALEELRDRLHSEQLTLQNEQKNARDRGSFLETTEQQKLAVLTSREKQISSALAILWRHPLAFSEGSRPWNYEELAAILFSRGQRDLSDVETLPLGKAHPLIENILIDWHDGAILLSLHPDVIEERERVHSASTSTSADRLNRLIYEEMARIGRESGEEFSPLNGEFATRFDQLEGSTSLLVMNLDSIVRGEGEQLVQLIQSQWHPKHPDLQREAFPIWDYTTFRNLPREEQKFGLLIYTPAQFAETPLPGLRPHSIYVIAKGMERLHEKIGRDPDETRSHAFFTDFQALRTLLKQSGFFGYPGDTYPMSAHFARDFFFEKQDFYRATLEATREAFAVRGQRKYAVLEFSDLKQRLTTLNAIETKEHEDLLKWRDEYRAAQVRSRDEYDIPAPTKNVFLHNLRLSAKKYFRGDERKILHWGLDLSGGKTVQIQLQDGSGRTVTDEVSLDQGIDELYRRVNKMGVSQVSIRREGPNIALDFPSAQHFSATDLIQASSMYFHVVNEKFSTLNPHLAAVTDAFLQGIWNEALITNQKNPEDIQAIAWRHLYGSPLDDTIIQPIDENARILYDRGLRLRFPRGGDVSNAFDDSTSKIGIMRGDNPSDWKGQTHPLLIVMNNYALEGANLDHVRASYDPSQGNFLSFEVKSSQRSTNGEVSHPRQALYSWSSAFSREKVVGTPLGECSRENGWRMAVILNGRIIQAPRIESPLRDRVSITGNFTQREARLLESDLKAGALSFSPRILSEKNVSAELGLKDRVQGIIATAIALLFVLILMIGYYRFAGVIASVALLVNLLIIWATLQNIQATITLAGIAGIILTVGMAVDANVLVFERIREELAISNRLASALYIGYRKALSAILDSNVTTVIAALILLHFDSGPIKGFALTLIIGIASSMFTALFLTRYFFASWIQKSKNKKLTFPNLLGKSHFDFLKYRKASLGAVALIALIGLSCFASQYRSMFGIDFTGGYTLSFALRDHSRPVGEQRNLVERALLATGVSEGDFHVRELSASREIKLFLGKVFDRPHHPFCEMPLETEGKNCTYPYQSNPRISWVVDALERGGLELTPQSLSQLDAQWTSIGGQISHTMRHHASISLGLALICILIYITIRFEFKYAMSATLCLAIDIATTVSSMSILHALGIPLQFDLNTIAALMTIIGYSLNDTIVIFDRIREDLQAKRKAPLKEVVNHALNVTLSRTLMTSSTTLVVLLALVLFGGSAIFGLSCVMIFGVLFGTFSSLFIAAPLLLFFQNRKRSKSP